MDVDFSKLPDPQSLEPKSSILTPIEFQKIKNHLLNDYSATEPGRFTYYLYYDQEHFWKLISEKYPIPRDLNLLAVDKAGIVWERLMQEPSPKRFVELCQAIIDHIFYVQHLPSTERNSPMHFADTMHIAFLEEVWKAFEAHNQEGLLIIEKNSYDPELDRSLKYIGNDFGQKESEKFITNAFESTTIDSAVILQNQRVIKKRWGISKFSPKLKFPGFEIGAEVERK